MPLTHNSCTNKYLSFYLDVEKTEWIFANLRKMYEFLINQQKKTQNTNLCVCDAHIHMNKTICCLVLVVGGFFLYFCILFQKSWYSYVSIRKFAGGINLFSFVAFYIL